jgi:anthranilate synthase component 1
MKKSNYFPSLEDFVEKSRSGNIIPVSREILADTETPVSAFKRIDTGGDAFLFESVEGGEKWGRYSFLGTAPRAVIKSKGSGVEIIEAGEKNLKEGDPIEIIKDYMSAYNFVDVPGAPKFSGGAIGYIGYDAIRHIEKLPEMTEDDLNMPDIFLVITDTLLVFDNMDHKMTIVSNAFIEEGVSPDAAYKEATEKIDSIVERLKVGLFQKPGSDEESKAGEVVSNFKKDDFLSAVEKTKEYIRAGDIIQAVISQRFAIEFQGGNIPFDTYRALRIINPSPYMFFLRLADLTLAGSSPEILVGTEGRDIRVRPIAGTRPRGADEPEDLKLEAELLADPKERAEHIMLVDLGRNDVGRVAETGSVEVDELMVIERYSHVMHIVSNVKGLLKKGKDAFDALRACFPAGTLSGAPKVRAMEIIEEVEPTRRAAYGGSVGYISFSGNMDMCITIRTILFKDNHAYVQAGAGIVADSNPVKEFEETENKARGMIKAVEMAIDGLE